jgi:glyoxylase-like metal-dependent hydrolase (beta-lactamase superfamily II)
MTTKAPAVRVRMYRQGLGDCFLLTFPRGDGSEAFVLIDCGVILGQPDAEKKMRAVAEDLHKRTGGRIDVLIATHEHWDHLSGFVQAKEVFESLTFDAVWLAWTEDPADPLAKRLRSQRHRALRGLHLAMNELAERAPDSPIHGAVRQVLDFFGPLSAKGTAGTADALDFLKSHGKTIRYCRPGEEPLALPGVPGVRVYVLGPPEDEKLIKKSNPSKKGQEVYTLKAGPSPDQAFLVAVRHRAEKKEPSDGDQELYELSFPFDACHKLTPAQAKKIPLFKDHYGFDKEGAEAWRRIDDDWLSSAGPLALQLDSNTNNTSLALAIELPGGEVLLFPGDAQVGNWLSWEGCSWSLGDGRKERRVTAADLLARTVLYKVGHHASHNATLRAKGLELMTSPDLVALIPVDHEEAVKKRWNMPFPHLLKRLKEKTAGRVLRLDTGLPDKPKDVAAARWKAFTDRVTQDKLFFEYTLPL